MLQVNGKLRGSLRVPADASQAGDREDRARQRGASPSIAEGAVPKRVIVVPGPAGQRRAVMQHGCTHRSCRAGLPAGGRGSARARRLRLRAAQGARLRLQEHLPLPGNSAFVNYAAAQPRARPARSRCCRRTRLPRPKRSWTCWRENRDNDRALDQRGRPGARAAAARLTMRFRLRTPGGKELLAPTEIQQPRDITYNETAALAKEGETELLYRDMQNDIAQQIDAPPGGRQGALIARAARARVSWPRICRRASSRSTPSTATSRCSRRRRPTRSARRRARRATPSAARYTVAGAHFDWSAVLAAGGSLSLFADRQIVEIRIPSGKPGKDGSARAAADRRGRAGQRQHADAGDAAAPGQGHAHRRLVLGAGEQRRQPADRSRSSAPRCRNGSRSGWRSRASA